MYGRHRLLYYKICTSHKHTTLFGVDSDRVHVLYVNYVNCIVVIKIISNLMIDVPIYRLRFRPGIEINEGHMLGNKMLGKTTNGLNVYSDTKGDFKCC